MGTSTNKTTKLEFEIFSKTFFQNFQVFYQKDIKMNPLTNMKNLNKMNDREIEMGVAGTSSSWHNEYKDSAWIYSGGLPYDLTEGDIICVFSQYGEIVHINLIRDHKTGKSKGFAFICYEDQRSTVLAVDNLNGMKLCGRLVRVDHVHTYKLPKNLEKMDEDRKKLFLEGCAPKPILETKPEPEEESENDFDLTEKKKNKKKHKKEKKKKSKKRKRKHSESSDDNSSSEDSDQSIDRSEKRRSRSRSTERKRPNNDNHNKRRPRSRSIDQKRSTNNDVQRRRRSRSRSNSDLKRSNNDLKRRQRSSRSRSIDRKRSNNDRKRSRSRSMERKSNNKNDNNYRRRSRTPDDRHNRSRSHEGQKSDKNYYRRRSR